MYIQLDLGWMRHPFPSSSFRIASAAQIETVRSLGLTAVRYLPVKSDPELREPPPPVGHDSGVSSDGSAENAADSICDKGPEEPEAGAVPQSTPASVLGSQLEAQQRSLAACDQGFLAATRLYGKLADAAPGSPVRARVESEALVSGCVTELLGNGDSVIRLLSEGVGERNALHPVNVMVLSLLLGKACGATEDQLNELGMAALLHDLGKVRLPTHFTQRSPSMSAADLARYQSHVELSVGFARRMDVPQGVLTAIAQHHEMVDGSGFPMRLSGEKLSQSARILALVNRYDNLCNPVHSTEALTPHEALAVIFAQLSKHFDPKALNVFIRMMGVYPPGTIVQLVNEQYAMVVSVNSSRPLRPKVIVHDGNVPKEQALVLDLETKPELGIRRSLKPAQLPRDALDYLSPRTRICYFFERAVDPGSAGAGL